LKSIAKTHIIYKKVVEITSFLEFAQSEENTFNLLSRQKRKTKFQSVLKQLAAAMRHSSARLFTR
jgi:hypothetical protein